MGNDQFSMILHLKFDATEHWPLLKQQLCKRKKEDKKEEYALLFNP